MYDSSEGNWILIGSIFVEFYTGLQNKFGGKEDRNLPTLLKMKKGRQFNKQSNFK